MTDVWLGDEEDEELPVIPAGTDSPPPTKKKRQRHRPPPKGNTPAAQAETARRQAIAEATGRALAQPSWRDDLAGRQRDRASTKLTSRSPTHNAGSGYGLS